MTQKTNSKEYLIDSEKITQPASIAEEGESIKDFFTVYQERIEKLLKLFPTTVESFYKKDDVVRVLKSTANSFLPNPDDPDISLNTEVRVGCIVYDICKLLSLNIEEIEGIIGKELTDELNH